MFSHLKKGFSLLLSLIFILTLIPPAFVRADDTPDYTLTSKEIIRAAYTTDNVTVNGRMNEKGWCVASILDGTASASVQWDEAKLYVAVCTTDKSDVKFTVGGKEITGANATVKVSTNKLITEYSVTFGTLGITPSYGTKIDAKIEAGTNVWDGSIVLTSIEWFAADNPNYLSPISVTGRYDLKLVHPASKPNGNQNVSKVEGGYNFFDRYSATTNNPLSVWTYLTFAGDAYAPLGDRTADTLLEFDFLAESMPVYKLGTDNDFYSEYSLSGFSWYITDAVGHFVYMAIVNTDAGLVFVLHNMGVNDNGPTYSCALNKSVGDKFRIGTNWTTDGAVILYVDGEIVDVIENAESTHKRMEQRLNNITFNLMRGEHRAESEADNFEIFITNVARGKYYGENPIDAVGFHTLQKDAESNPSALEITADLTLPTSFTHPQIGKKISLKWESSDSSVIDPATGKVTRPAENGKTVTLTATDTATGDTKSFKLYVKGLSPTADVLAVTNDLTTQKGKGVAYDGYEFTLDTTYNSIIRDLKEPTKVNVIALKDGDDVNNLTEQLVTIWVSDNNKNYEEIKDFKLLRAGEYTYLYDFEATARYIKVHSTSNSTNDCAFIGPLHEMIDAYYENVFGGGNSPFATVSAVTIENETDTANFDYIYKISAADAGVKCVLETLADVRFYLDGELLYHYFDGEYFYVRVTKIPKNSSVTLKVLSGNASAMDISNKANVHEIIFGTVEAYVSVHARKGSYVSNGRVMGVSSPGATKVPFNYFFSTDNGRSWTNGINANDSYDYLCIPWSTFYDDETGRVLVSGYRTNDDGTREIRFMYSDNLGKTWQKAPFTGENESLYTYCSFAKVNSCDGAGDGVDYVIAFQQDDDDMAAYYNNGYPHSVTRVAYSVDAGESWILSPDVIGYYDADASGDHIHKREHGLTEQGILAGDGDTVLVYMRCQYDGIYTLARSISYDNGKTWQTKAELSDVYSPNTQPWLFEHADNKFMLWGGNNMFGQSSFRRYPINVGVSYDGLMTFENILDMTSKTPIQGMTTMTRIECMNPTLLMAGDSALVSITCTDRSLMTVRWDDFTDYFFRTRGAYDDFEQTTAEYEGWAVTGGEIGITDAQASNGKRSMYFTPCASAVRSIPYVQDGTISFDLYLEDVDQAKFQIELESAFSFGYGEGTPIAFELVGNKATFLGESAARTLDVKDGWNHFEFKLSLASDTPSATLSVNGGEASAVPVDAEIGDYVCFVHVSCLGSLTYYLDDFYVEDMDNAYVPDVLLSADAALITEVPDDLSHLYDTPEEVITAMQEILLKDAPETVTADTTAVYTLTPKISKDGGDTWAVPTKEQLLTGTLTFTIPYPDGVPANEYAFRALALYDDDYDPYTKDLRIVETKDGLLIELAKNAPIILFWEAASDPQNDPVVDPSGTPATSDSALSPILIVGIAVVTVALLSAILVCVKITKKQNS